MPDPTPSTVPAPDDAAVIRAALVAQLRAAGALGADGKPGWKTTEFWGHVATQVVGAAIVAWGMYRSSDMLVMVGGFLTGGSQVGYALARAMVKRVPSPSPASAATA